MPTTAAFTVTASISGAPQGGTQYLHVPIVNTISPAINTIVSITTSSTGAVLLAPNSTQTRIVLIIPPSTNQVPWRLVPSTAGDTGIAVAPSGPQLLTIPSTGAFYAYTTGGDVLAGWRVYEY